MPKIKYKKERIQKEVINTQKDQELRCSNALISGLSMLRLMGDHNTVNCDCEELEGYGNSTSFEIKRLNGNSNFVRSMKREMKVSGCGSRNILHCDLGEFCGSWNHITGTVEKLEEGSEDNYILGNVYELNGNGNYVSGYVLNLTGEKNMIMGYTKRVNGDDNEIHGDVDVINGNNNLVFGNVNMILGGTGNRVFGTANFDSGKDNTHKNK